MIGKSEILSIEQPFSYTEAYKSLRTNLEFATLSGKNKVIAITSSVPREGKSTFSINLAITLVEDNKSVLLIDGDLRNPSLHRYLRIRQANAVGLSTVLGGAIETKNAITYNKKHNLNLILSGPVPPNPVELLSSDKMKNLIEEVKVDFDYIIIDTPPVGIVTDAVVMSKYVDGLIVVVGQGLINQVQIQRTRNLLNKVNANIIGAILNNYKVSKDSKNTDRYESYGYGFGE